MLWDLIDHFYATNLFWLGLHDFDAIIVMTAAHERWLAEHRFLSITLPHAHTNIGRWSLAKTVRNELRGVGIIYGNKQSIPPPQDLAQILKAVCANNATLYLVESIGALNLIPQPCPGKGRQLRTRREGGGSEGGTLQIMGGCAAEEENVLSQCERTTREGPPATEFGSLAAPLPSLTLAQLLASERKADAIAAKGGGGEGGLVEHSIVEHIDPKGAQRKYYESAELLEKIDLGLLWWPNREKSLIGHSAWTIANRDSTRMAWWWSHGIPVIGYPMNGYLDLSKRSGYPQALLNLTTGADVSMSLCALRTAKVRGCLHKVATAAGEHLSSVHASARDFLAGVCRVGAICKRHQEHDSTDPRGELLLPA